MDELVLDKLERLLYDLEQELRSYTSDDTIIAGYEQEYAEVAHQAEAIRQQICQLAATPMPRPISEEEDHVPTQGEQVTLPGSEPHAPLAEDETRVPPVNIKEHPHMLGLAELQAELRELEKDIQSYAPGGVVNPRYAQEHAEAAQQVETIRRQIQEMTAPRPASATMSTGENLFYSQFIARAQVARQERRWNDALYNLDNALAFATGDQDQDLQALRAEISAERQRFADEEMDRKTVALVAEALDLAKANRYVAALDKINEAINTTRPERKEEVKVKRDDLLRSQEDLAGALQSQVEAALERVNLDEAERLIAALIEVVGSVAAVAEFRKRAGAARQAQVIQKEFKSLRADLEAHWARGGLTEASEARRKAENASAMHPDVEVFVELEKEARQRYEDIAKREAIVTTSAALENFSKALQELQIAREQRPNERLPMLTIDPVLSSKSGRLEPIVKVVNYDAPDVAIGYLSGQIGSYNEKKAQEYLGLAQQQVTANPQRAQQLIDEARKFLYLPDPTTRALEEELSKVTPKVQVRTQVDREALVASQMLDVLGGWQKLNAAAERDPAAPSIGRARDELRPAMEAALPRRLEACEQEIEARRWVEAETQAKRLADLLQGDDGLAVYHQRAETLRRRAVKLQSLQHEIQASRDEMSQLIQNNPDVAAERLVRLQREAESLLGHFPEAAFWSDRIKARRNYRAALADIEASYRDLTQEQLDQRLERLARLESEVGRTEESAQTRDRLRMRRKFLMAEQFYNTGGASRDDAEKWFKEITEGEDASRAADYLQKIESQRQLSDQAARALEDAEDQVKRLRDFRQALASLQQWGDQPGVLGQQIRDRIRNYRDAWQERVKEQLDVIVRAMQGQDDWVAPLEQIETRVGEFRELAPADGREWEQKFMPTIYRSIAGRMMRAGGAEGPEAALRLLDKALKLAPESEDLRRERRVAARSVALQKARRPEKTFADVEAVWREFLSAYPDDPQPLCELGRLATRRSDFTMALRYLDLAWDYDEAQEHAWQTAIRQARDEAEEARRLFEGKQKIENALKPESTIFQYIAAENTLQELQTTYPQRKGELASWFDAHKVALREDLSRKLKELPAEAPERWEIALKILHLDPQAPDAHAEVERAVMQLQRLESDTNALLNDLTGPTHIVMEGQDGKKQLVEIEAYRALDVQIEQAQELQKRAYQLKGLLDEQSRSLGQVPEQQTAGECVRKINKRLGELDQLAQKVQQARATLRGARQAIFAVRRSDSNEDPFEPVANLLGDILKLPVSFANHITVQALSRELADARQRRQMIESLLERLQKAVNAEDFDVAIKVIDDILALDEQGDFSVRQNLRVHDPWAEQDLRLVGRLEDNGLDGLRGQLIARQEQWRKVFAWQRPMGLVGWSAGQPVRADCQRLSWDQHAALRCLSRWRHGLFDEARQIIEDAVGDESSVARLLDGRWSLRRCQRYLGDPQGEDGQSLDVFGEPEKGLSHKTRAVIEARCQALAAVEADLLRLVGPRSDGGLPEIERLKHEDENFYAYWSSIGELLGQLQSRGFLGIGKVSRDERASLCAQLIEAVKSARAIASEYDGWAAVGPQIAEVCPGGLQ